MPPASPTFPARLANLARWLWCGSSRPAAPNDNPLGRKGEAEAVRFLKKHGHTILARNVRVKIGEADIVALAPDKQTIIIVEVKSREVDRNDPHSLPPEANLTKAKRLKLRGVRRALIRANHWAPSNVRIDAIAVEREDLSKGRNRWTIRHHEDIKC